MHSSPQAQQGGQKRRWKSVLDITASLLMIVASTVLLWTLLRPAAASSAAIPGEPIAIDGAPTEGSPDARVVLITFSDFQCPFCGRFARETLPTLRKLYIETGRVRLIFRHLPLINIHPLARQAAEIAECGAKQGRFVTVHDALFAKERFDATFLAALPAQVRLDRPTFDACLAGPVKDRLQQDGDLAKTLGVTGTPLFMVGLAGEDGRVQVSNVIRGARPLGHFTAALDRLLVPSPGA